MPRATIHYTLSALAAIALVAAIAGTAVLGPKNIKLQLVVDG